MARDDLFQRRPGDELLDKRRMHREIVISTPYFLLVGDLVRALPVIATVPRRYGQLCARTSELSISKLPFNSPRFNISMMWHARDDDDPALTFLRQTLTRGLQTMASAS